MNAPPPPSRATGLHVRPTTWPIRLAGLLVGASALALNPVGAGAASKAHEHGVARLDVAIDGPTLTLALESPLDSLLGFERAPRNDKERRAAAELLARLRSGTGLFGTDAAAQCRLTRSEAQSPALEPVAPDKKSQAARDIRSSEHADLEATFVFTCTQPQQLRTLDVGLFQAFGRLQRIDVQVAGPKGQGKTTLKRPARSVMLQR